LSQIFSVLLSTLLGFSDTFVSYARQRRPLRGKQHERVIDCVSQSSRRFSGQNYRG
jgi:hypothetical protein